MKKLSTRASSCLSTPWNFLGQLLFECPSSWQKEHSVMRESMVAVQLNNSTSWFLVLLFFSCISAIVLGMPLHQKDNPNKKGQ